VIQLRVVIADTIDTPANFFFETLPLWNRYHRGMIPKSIVLIIYVGRPTTLFFLREFELQHDSLPSLARHLLQTVYTRKDETNNSVSNIIDKILSNESFDSLCSCYFLKQISVLRPWGQLVQFHK